jgi:hypothetical protein
VQGLEGWEHTADAWSHDLLRRVAEHDPSAQLRQKARDILTRHVALHRLDELRLQLPPDLRAKTERHPGRLVAIAEGRIVGVDDPRAFRHARRTYPEMQIYWVRPRNADRT